MKLEGVRRVFEHFYGDVEIRSTPYTNAPRQPVGAEQTIMVAGFCVPLVEATIPFS
ncbi:hypothetical protein B9Q08_00245, partial [Candidatus Marsarchaeota G2 archaeon ECH_B_SAG-M15]